jgi:hypothetical protein
MPWPEETGTSANDTRATWAMHVAARRALVEATRLLTEAGVPSLAVKGVVTAYWLYSDPTERPIGDVDVRIRPEDFRKAARAFEEAEWKIVDWKPVYGAFAAERNGVCVDVESVIGAPGLCGLSIGEMLGRAVDVEVGVGVAARGATVRVPEVHDHAVLLAVNVFKDKLVDALPWSIEDAKRVVVAPGFDAGEFVERARAGKVAGIVWIVADWIGREAGSAKGTPAGWAGIRTRLGGDRGPRPVYARLFRWLLGHAKADALAMRVVTRLGSDATRMWPGALRSALALSLESSRRHPAG